jgi:molecular chaperone GrpE
MDDQNKKQDNRAGDEKTEKTVEEKLVECHKQAEEYLNNWKRERADFINYKNDEAKRAEEFVKFVNKDLILDMLDFYDDFLMAYGKLAPLKISEELNKWADGLLRIGEKFRDILKKYDVVKIKTDIPFNPELHEAISTEEGGEKVEEARAGYTMYGKVIRSARVKIVK